MTARFCASARAVAAAALAGGLACATSPGAGGGRPCQGLTPAAALHVVPLDLPTAYSPARIGANMPAEVTVGLDGKPRDVAVRTKSFDLLAPFAEETLKRGMYTAGSFEGNPVSVRLPVRIPLGGSTHGGESQAPAEIWAYTAPGQSREARWQLRDSVTQLTVVARVPRLAAPGAIVAVAPDGQTKTLLAVPASPTPQDIRQTVATGKFLAAPGEYRLELRGASVLASARFAIADDFRDAVINACEPLVLIRKTGPGN